MIIKNAITYFLLSLLLFGIYPETSTVDEDIVRKDPNLLNEAVVPLKRVGNLLLIDATVDGVSGSFVLDTGAPGLVLNATYFRDGKPTYGSQGGGVSGINIQRKTKKIEKFILSGLVFENVSADVINLRHIENTKKTKILGLIGAAFIEDFEVIIDTRKMSMQMLRVDRKGVYIKPHVDKTKYHIQQKTFLYNNVIVTYIPIAGKKVCFCLDTGAERNTLDNRSHGKILETISITGRKYLKGASDQRIEVLFGIMNDFMLSGHQLGGMNVVMLDLSTMRQSFGVNVGGMLGYDFFKLGKININLRKKLMSIALYD
jgi:hypothetical protein